MFSRTLQTVFATGLLMAGCLLAQTGTTPPPVTLASFTEESLITSDQLTSGDAPSLSDDLINAVQSGAVEVHQLISYDSTQGTLSISLVGLPVGTPIPSSNTASGTIISSFTAKVSSITATQNAVIAMGTIQTAQGIGGATVGGLVTATIGYTIQTPDPTTGASSAVFNTVDVSVAGVGSLNSRAGRGSLKTTGQGSQLPLAVAGPKGLEVFTPSFSLTAQGSKSGISSTSTSTSSGLTYKWALIPSVGQEVNIQGANTATPLVTLIDNGFVYGVYTFQLTVTNQAGLSSIDIVTVDYEPVQ